MGMAFIPRKENSLYASYFRAQNTCTTLSYYHKIIILLFFEQQGSLEHYAGLLTLESQGIIWEMVNQVNYNLFNLFNAVLIVGNYSL